jgi:hypothetical protein
MADILISHKVAFVIYMTNPNLICSLIFRTDWLTALIAVHLSTSFLKFWFQFSAPTRANKEGNIAFGVKL